MNNKLVYDLYLKAYGIAWAESEDQVYGGRELENGDHSPDWDAALECVHCVIVLMNKFWILMNKGILRNDILF